MTLKNKTIIITGSTRGIGRAMALRFAKDGANIVVLGKSDQPNDKLPGTIHTVAEEVIAAGGKALPVVCDIRDDKQITHVVEQAVEHFGGVDILVNNASAIAIRDTMRMTPKRFDLLMGVNVRGTFFMSRECLPHLIEAENPHILNIAPPLNMEARWFKDMVAYTYSKYGMSVCTLGMSAEFKQQGVAVNSLWPLTTIATAAIEIHFPKEIYERSRKPAIMADAAYEVVNSNSRENSGNFYIDEDVLTTAGVQDFEQYAMKEGAELQQDYFIS
jgi:citronellol/citronellal dehydrogenase